MKIKEIIAAIEDFAPPRLQESYDNTGYQVGDPEAEATGALLCVDVTEEIIDEAVAKGCNLIISHHPLIFRGLKSVTGANRPERALAKAILSGVTVYSSHTATDSTVGGVSWRMAEMLGLRDVNVLVPSSPGASRANVARKLRTKSQTDFRLRLSAHVASSKQPTRQPCSALRRLGRRVHTSGYCRRSAGLRHRRL